MSDAQDSAGGFHVFTNMAISMDGKIATKERVHTDPSSYDAFMMDKLRARAHAVLVGATTLRAFRKPATIEHRRFHLLRRARGLNGHHGLVLRHFTVG